jgi:hypothetical protein
VTIQTVVQQLRSFGEHMPLTISPQGDAGELIVQGANRTLHYGGDFDTWFKVWIDEGPVAAVQVLADVEYQEVCNFYQQAAMELPENEEFRWVDDGYDWLTSARVS